MTPRVDVATISLVLLGVSAITGAAIGLGCYTGSAGWSLGFFAGAVATWLFLVASLARLRWELSSSQAESDAESETNRDTNREGNGAISAATALTIGRGFLVALVAGWVLTSAPTGPARWVPGALYAIAVLMDGVDGALARRTARVTKLGARLDVTTDAVGLLVASLVGMRWGRLPPWYLALSLAYPAFRAALWLRRARGAPIYLHRLRRDPRARFFAGVQMTVVTAALLPPLPGSVVWTAASLAMLPTLALFVGEWRLVTSPAEPRPDAPSRARADADADAGADAPSLDRANADARAGAPSLPGANADAPSPAGANAGANAGAPSLADADADAPSLAGNADARSLAGAHPGAPAECLDV